VTDYNPSSDGGPPTHIFTVDVEEYFQVSAFDSIIERSEWGDQPSRIEANVDAILALLAAHDTLGTFFTLGWIAERYPRLVRRIADGGHEIASHGWWHRKLGDMTPGQFRTDVRDARRCLQDVSGCAVRGYRAPSFSLVPGKEWAFDVLLEEGYSYDSSLFPIRRPGYGYPSAPLAPHMIDRPSGALLELPLATTSIFGARIPAAGGGYLRHFPLGVIQRAFREHTRDGVPAVFYIHPWELDPDQPRLEVPALTRLRHYSGLSLTKPRIETLLREFRFTSVEFYLGQSERLVTAGARVPSLLR
jgi:polysaccharide deacetylase family protein (PEP-CTERM system associated)